MIYLEKSELPFSKRPTKNYITHSPEKKDLNHPPPPPHLYPNHQAPDVFLFFQFLSLKKLTMRNCVLVKLKQYLVIILRTDRK